MAKPFGLGGGAAPGVQPAGTPPIRPTGQGGGLFPNMDAQRRYDMAMAMLQQGMQSASASNSPLLAFLAPLAGAGIGGAIESRYGKARAEATEGINDTLLGTMSGDPRAQGLIDILNNPEAPDYAKSMAKDRLAALMAPPKVSGGGVSGNPRSSSKAPANTDALLASMFHRAMDPDSDGGDSITPAEQARIDSVRAARARSSAATVTYDTLGSAPAGSAKTEIDGYIIEQID